MKPYTIGIITSTILENNYEHTTVVKSEAIGTVSALVFPLPFQPNFPR